MAQQNIGSFWQIAKYGFFDKCPNCGKGKLFSSYLKQVEECSICTEKFGHITADDGPAWFTILIIGHILAPFLLHVLPGITWPDWAVMATLIPVILLLIYIILPRAKGLFIAMIWRSSCLGSEK